jgi:hypothetical protein
MPAKTQLIGGNFQDLEGNVLANGYFTMRLNQDETVNDSQVCSGIIIRIQLDSTGNVATTSSTPPVTNQFVWANDIMVPVNSYYTVTVYSAAGQIVWGPNNQQVTSGGVGGGTFDVGTWAPNTVISWSPSAQLVEFEVAGVPLSSQTTVDFVNTGNVTFTDEGGGQISASAGGSGGNVANTPWQVYQDQGGIPASAAIPTAGFNYVQIMFANSIVSAPTSWNVTLYVSTALSAPIVEFCVIRTLRNSLTTVDVTPITFGGSHTPTFSSVGPVTSDDISLAIDSTHDYYFCLAGNAFGGTGELQTSGAGNLQINVYAANPDTGGNALSSLWASSIGAGGGFNGAFPNGSSALVGFFLVSWLAA